MIYLSWNCRGHGNHRKILELCLMVQEKLPTIVFLIETKSNGMRLESVRKKLGFSGCLCIDSIGKKGGLALL